MLPLDGRLQFVQGDARIFKNAIDLQRPFLNRGIDMAALCIHLKADVGVLNAGPIFGRRARLSSFKIKVINAAVGGFDLVCFVLAGVIFCPLNLQRVDQTTELVFQQALPGWLWQWQLKRDVAKCEQV